MELKSFIKQALLDIVNGVNEAQQESGNSKIVPPLNNKLDFASIGLSAYQVVKFEVSVRIDESKGSEGKIGVVSSFIGASMAGKSSNEKEHLTTLSFSVPILLPTQN